MAFKLKIKTGAATTPTTLDVAELGYASAASNGDKHLFIGNGSGVDATKFYNATKVDTLLGNKSDVGHTHLITDVFNLDNTLAGKAANTITITGTNGLTGGGNLTTNRTISHATLTPTVTGSAGAGKAVTSITQDTYGHVSALTYTDWNTYFAPYNANGYVAKAGDETIAGVKTFSSIPVLPSTAPTQANQAASKAYVDSVAQGLDIKQNVIVASTVNVPLTGSSGLTIDTVALLTGDRILLKNQTTTTQNGIYVVTTDGSTTYSLARSADMANGSDANSCFVFVVQGSVNANTGWVVTGADTTSDFIVTVGTDAMTWSQFTGAASFSLSGTTPISATRSGNTWTISHLDDPGYKHVPSGGNENQVLVNLGLGAIGWGDPTVTFTALTDTPASYTGAGSKLVAVNSGATALEFVNTLDCGTY